MNGGKRNKGVMMVELAMVMILLSLFGITIFTLILTGAETQARLLQEKDTQSDVRIALSYINVRLRQNDSEGKINVEPIALTGQNALVFRERTFDYEYDTWIYSHNGILYECLTDPFHEPAEELSFPIISLERLETVLNEDGSITNTIYYFQREQLNDISSTVFPRSNN